MGRARSRNPTLCVTTDCGFSFVAVSIPHHIVAGKVNQWSKTMHFSASGRPKNKETKTIDLI